MSALFVIGAAVCGVAAVVLIVVGFVGMLFEGDPVWEVITFRSFVAFCIACVLCLAFVVLWLLTSAKGPTVVAGRCYQAVAHGAYVPTTVGKVVIPMYTESTDLVEINCP